MTPSNGPGPDWQSHAALAQGAFDELIQNADQALGEADELIAGMDAEKKPATDEEVRALQQYATSPNAPQEWKRVADRVQSGQLTWREVADGAQTGDILAAIDASARVRMDPAQAQPTSPPQPGRSSWDDEDFSNNSYLR